MKDDYAALKREMEQGQAALRREMQKDHERIMDHLFRIVWDLGEVKGELKRIGPKEKITGGS